MRLKALVLLTLLSPMCSARELRMPYREAGLSPRSAAIHLLNRLSFGPGPGEVDRVVARGLERWVEEQLAADLPEQELTVRLRRYPSLTMSDRDICAHYLETDLLERMAVKAGALAMPPRVRGSRERKAVRDSVTAWVNQHGLQYAGSLRQEMMAQKLVRALYAKNQTREVLTDFWFNHFNTSFFSWARPYMLSYERDAIRPNSMGPFLPLLLATAKHPAMLAYLGNAQSTASAAMNRGRQAGINENYGREVMELHTLGGDARFTQHDVTDVARALTGWGIYPMVPQPKMAMMRRQFDRADGQGTVVQGDFLFQAQAHDAGPKRILGRKFPPGGGLSEGEEVLRMLAQHPATARFISRKFAVRFVSDTPSESLVGRLSETFRRSRGDSREMMRTIVESPEFWSAQARASKVKSPFELVVSSMRALDAEVEPNMQCYDWVERMGQPLYACASPTGFPDRAQSWINSGTLTYRINYELALAAGRIRGVKVDLERLGSREQAARTLLGDANLGAFTPSPWPAFNWAPVQAQFVGILLASPQFQRR